MKNDILCFCGGCDGKAISIVNNFKKAVLQARLSVKEMEIISETFNELQTITKEEVDYYTNSDLYLYYPHGEVRKPYFMEDIPALFKDYASTVVVPKNGYWVEVIPHGVGFYRIVEGRSKKYKIDSSKFVEKSDGVEEEEEVVDRKAIEANVIGCLLLDNRLLTTALSNGLDDNCFRFSDYSVIFIVISKLNSDLKFGMNIIHVCDKFKDLGSPLSEEYLFDLAKKSDASMFEEDAIYLIDNRKGRRIN